MKNTLLNFNALTWPYKRKKYLLILGVYISKGIKFRFKGKLLKFKEFLKTCIYLSAAGSILFVKVVKNYFCDEIEIYKFKLKVIHSAHIYRAYLRHFFKTSVIKLTSRGIPKNQNNKRSKP